VLEGDGLRKIVAARVSDQVPPGFSLLPGDISLSTPTNVRYSDGVISLQITATARSQAQISAQDARRAAAGKPVEDVQAELERLFVLAQPPEVVLHQSRFGRMPFLTSRISVIIVKD